MLRTSITVALVASLFIARAARADEPEPPTPANEAATAPAGAHLHDGFYLRVAGNVSLVPGFSSASLGVPAGAPRIGGDLRMNEGMILVGGTPLRGLAIGGGLRTRQTSGRFVGGEANDYRVGTFEPGAGAFVDWYPDPTKGWHVGAYAGAIFAIADGKTWLHSNGALDGAIFGGYDFWVGKEWSFAALLTATASTPASLRDKSGRDTGYDLAPIAINAGIGWTFH